MLPKNRLLVTLFLCGLPGLVRAQFTDTFDTLNPGWVTNRYAPAGFSPELFLGDNRLLLTIDQSGSTANRDISFSSSFYNVQGRERPGNIAGLWSLSAEVYIPASFGQTAPTDPLVRSSIWGHTGTTPGGGDYMILGFANTSPTDPLNPAALDRTFRFHAFDGDDPDSVGGWYELAAPGGFAFDAWHTLTGVATGSAFEYYLDGALLHSNATALGSGLLSGMIQGYNFGQSGYSVYWDNFTATAIPEPATFALVTALAALGLAWGRRRRVGG